MKKCVLSSNFCLYKVIVEVNVKVKISGASWSIKELSLHGQAKIVPIITLCFMVNILFRGQAAGRGLSFIILSFFSCLG